MSFVLFRRFMKSFLIICSSPGHRVTKTNLFVFVNSIFGIVLYYAVVTLSQKPVTLRRDFSYPIIWNDPLCNSRISIRNNSHSMFIYTCIQSKWAPSSEFVSSSIPSWQILTAHAQPFRGARDLAFCLKVPLDSLLVWASSEGSGETARMRRLAWTFAARIGYKYQIRLTRSKSIISQDETWRKSRIFLS